MTAASLLPNLIIPGVGKAGTTSLFSYLGEHPEICASDTKELNHFTDAIDGADPGALEGYAAHFSHWSGERYRLEASPAYWYNASTAIPAIKQVLDRPRIIIALRDPAARLWSSYTYLKSLGRISAAMTCDDFIDACEGHEGGPDSPTSGAVTPLTAGMYGDYLPAWIDAFGSDLRVVFAERLFEDPAAVVADLCHWLEISPAAHDGRRYEARNQTVSARSRVVAKTAWTGAPMAARLLRRQPGLRAALRKAYTALNGSKQREKLSPETRARLDTIYRESAVAAGRTLSAAGYTDLPEWLAETAGSL